MIRNPRVDDLIDDARSAVHRTARTVRDRTEALADDIRDRLPEANDLIGSISNTARRLVNEQPVACLAAVGILGVLIGMSARSRR
jgi:hypothetical protein